MTFSWNDGYQFREKSYLCSSLEVSQEAESSALARNRLNFKNTYKAQEQLIWWAA